MELIDNSVIAQTRYTGAAQVTMLAGKSLKIETSPSGAELLDVTVPAGKSWAVTLQVSVIESNA